MLCYTSCIEITAYLFSEMFLCAALSMFYFGFQVGEKWKERKKIRACNAWDTTGKPRALRKDFFRWMNILVFLVGHVITKSFHRCEEFMEWADGAKRQRKFLGSLIDSNHAFAMILSKNLDLCYRVKSRKLLAF